MSFSDLCFYQLYWGKHTGADGIFKNVYPNNWNECDVLIISKSGYVHEIECKSSKADFKNDFSKTNKWLANSTPFDKDKEYYYEFLERIEEKKHTLLESKTCFPNRFSFMVPEGLLDEYDVPEYAGLIYYREGYSRSYEVKKPPLLHREKLDEEYRFNLFKKSYYRYNDIELARIKNLMKSRA